MKAEQNSPLALFARAIERWENEGGQVAQLNRKRPPTPSPFVTAQRAHKDFAVAKKDPRRSPANG